MSSDATHRASAMPWLIQGGMGIAISDWRLARAVSRAGQLGVVSGTGIETVFARRLQDHGVDDALRVVLDTFPDQAIVERVLTRYAATRRTDTSTPYKTVPMLTHRNVHATQDVFVLAAFVEVALAKAGHDGIVGMNLLTKVQIPTVPTLYGAMLAGVDYILMGAGIPLHIPGVLDQLARLEEVTMPLDVVGEAQKERIPLLRFDPSRLAPSTALTRPNFLGIVSSHVLAGALAKRSSGVVNGVVVESPIAGGHNAPPRGALVLDDEGSPVYGERDRVNYAALVELGLPFWLAGGVTTPDALRRALDVGASGVQVGTLFAYCAESGMEPTLRREVMDQVLAGGVHVTTSVRASSTGYPFKVADVEHTLSDQENYDDRERVCDLGYLREAFMKSDGGIGYRCPSEPVEQFIAKGGDAHEVTGRVCLCNALMSSAGFAQIRRGAHREAPIVTSGDSINEISPLLQGRDDYHALDVIEFLRPGLEESIVAGEPGEGRSRFASSLATVESYASLREETP